MGDVYLRDPLNGELCWYDWRSYADYVNVYGGFDLGRFIWVSA